MPDTSNTRWIRAHKTPQLVSLRPRSNSSNSRKQIWISQPLSFRRSQSQAVSTLMRTLPTISRSSVIFRGTFHFTEVGTLALLQHCRAATTALALDSVGPLAIDKPYRAKYLSASRSGALDAWFPKRILIVDDFGCEHWFIKPLLA